MPNAEPLEHVFSFPLPNGLHARPASYLAETARAHRADLLFANTRTGRCANLRSVLGLVGTDTRAGDPCRITATGHGAAEALAELVTFLTGAFLHCDEPLPAAPISPPAGAPLVPRSLRAAGLERFLAGQIACRGLGKGVAVTARNFVAPDFVNAERPESAAVEQQKISRALEDVVSAHRAAAARTRGVEAEVLRAHLAILTDPELTEAIARAISVGQSAGQALVATVERHRAILAAAESAYLRERVLDLDDIAGRLLVELYGAEAAPRALILTVPSVVVAESLTPSQFLALDRSLLRGLVLAQGGQTSHTVILARSCGVPTLTAVTGVVEAVRAGTEVIVDAHLGLLVFEAPSGVRAWYAREATKLAQLAAEVEALRDREARTADGHRLEIGANTASVEETVAAFAQGAEGIGLFRTELVFSARATAPTEDEQYEIYAAVVRAAAGRPVVIRTLDVGGDKPVPFLQFPAEANPFLGYRAVRFYAEQAPLMRTQFRALLRAAALGPLKILVPMIACVEEARLVRRLVAEAAGELRASGVALSALPPLGFMLEVPAVAFLLDELCAEADFFSLGTNDLTQYFLAADRENPKLGFLQSPLHPGFLRLLKHLVDGARARGRWIGLCGELSENPTALPLLVGLGLDEISLAAPRLGATKAALAQLERSACAALLTDALRCATLDEVRELLVARARRERPMFDAGLVLDGVVARSKAEVIRAMIDALHASGRTEHPTLVEEAVWAREETYSTGFGEGFALPHCKTDALAANAVVLARLREPVEWGALDGKPVDTVVLLGIRASEHGKAHMEILARLSRLMMRDEFRSELRAESRPEKIVALLRQADRSASGAKS